MIDYKLLLQDLPNCIQRLGNRGVSKEELMQLQEDLLKKNQAIKQVEVLRSQKNQLSKKIQEHIVKKEQDLARQVKQQVQNIKENLKIQESRLIQYDKQTQTSLLNIPNFPDKQAPIGQSSKDNKEILKSNFDPKIFDSKKMLPHYDLMESLDMMDQKRAGKITGSMFIILKNSGAKLIRSLISFAFDLFEQNYTELLVPSLVNSASLTGTGHLPKFAEEAYHIEKDDLWAIPTGEVPLTAFHRQEILDESSLPLNYMTYTPCFRREAGAAGQDNRGLQRLHEFHKLELVKFCKASQSQQALQDLLQDALKPIKLLQLPYRVLDLCTKDLSFSATRTYDIEVYAPGTKSWLEVSSISLFSDYQCRRSQIRYREKKEILYPHSLNGSGLATPRVLAAILENGQQADGSIKLPKVLVKYMGKEYLS